MKVDNENHDYRLVVKSGERQWEHIPSTRGAMTFDKACAAATSKIKNCGHNPHDCRLDVFLLGTHPDAPLGGPSGMIWAIRARPWYLATEDGERVKNPRLHWG